MNRLEYAISLAMLCAPLFGATALPVVPARDQAALLKSRDPKLAANKKLAYDFFRIVIRARHVEEADKYMKPDYIQHNPMADTGIEGFKEFFKTRGGPLPVADTLPDLVAVQAEGDYVTLSFVREYDDPLNKGQKYTTTWFDMLRFENGKLAEHWDCQLKTPPPAPSAASKK
jgi:predicted SnoaL-like aldol condensation-catalyzing enzyme